MTDRLLSLLLLCCMPLAARGLDSLQSGSIRERSRLLTIISRTAATAAASLAIGTAAPSIAGAGNKGSFSLEKELYVDQKNGFSVMVPEGFNIMPRAPDVVRGLDKFLKEDRFVIGSNFVEGCSFGVTKTQAQRLLKDFEIDWWFAPIGSLQDMGSPQLIADLLILQRQGDFEQRQTSAEITSAVIEGNKLTFEYLTPLAREVNRKTRAVAYFKDGSLSVLWLSCLQSVFEGAFGDTLRKMGDSFQLL